jgi:hypothetical protein
VQIKTKAAVFIPISKAWEAMVAYLVNGLNFVAQETSTVTFM